MKKRHLVVIAILSIISSQLVGLYDAHRAAKYPVKAEQYANPAYVPQYGRNAEWDSQGQKTYSDAQIQNIVRNVGYEIIPKAADAFNIQAHFTDAKRIVDAGNAIGNHIKVFDYFNGAFWLNVNADGWKPYSDNFNSAWFLKDSKGQPVGFYGVGHSAKNGDQPIGYVYDEANPAFRAWAVATVVGWMKQAPYKGIALDSTDVLLGQTVRQSTGDGTSSWNDLLCGPGAHLDANGNCATVNAWNSGLTTLVGQLSAALRPLGDEVLYNGIAPSTARGPARNLGLLDQADVASNESFCYEAGLSRSTKVVFESLTDDAKIMQDQAAAHKKIFEITNYQDSSKLSYGNYCLGGFLMGWQPGYDYWIYHANYADSLSGTYPYVAEQNLNLGNPSTTTYVTNGSVLSRSFQNGFVAVNNGDSSASVTLPGHSLVQFKDGAVVASYSGGNSLSLPGRSAAFFLNDSFLHPAAGGTGGGTGTTSGGGTSPPTTGTGSSIGNNTKVSQDPAKPVSGDLTLTTAAGQYVKVEYFVDAKLIHTSTKFPDTWQLDTRTLKNGQHTLTIKYYQADGKVTVATKTITVSNPQTILDKALTVAQRSGPPALGTATLLLVAVFLVHHYRMTYRKWLRFTASTQTEATVITDETSAHSLPPAAVPGSVIAPSRSPSSESPDTQHNIYPKQ